MYGSIQMYDRFKLWMCYLLLFCTIEQNNSLVGSKLCNYCNIHILKGLENKWHMTMVFLCHPSHSYSVFNWMKCSMILVLRLCHTSVSSENMIKLKNTGEFKHFLRCILSVILNINWISLTAYYFTENQRDSQNNYMLKLYILWGNLGGLSLTSVSVIFTVVDPDSPPTCPAISLAWMTTE